MINLDDIQQFFRGYIGLNEPLSRHTSFKIGGPADYFLEPVDKEDVTAIVQYFHRSQIPFVMFGKGTNLLVSDEGVRVPVINIEGALHATVMLEQIVVAEAGVRLTKFVDFCIQHGRKGMEMLSGIPGTVGGAIIMNAGAYGGEISAYLMDVEIIREGTVLTIQKSAAGFAYRRSGLQRDVILSARFNLPEGDKAELMRIRRDLLIKRNQRQPLNFPNSGSIFKNPEGGYAARLIEDAGLKGISHGGAAVSEKHANFIVNTGHATASDVLALIRRIQAAVFKKSGITLEPEVKLVGFPKDVQEELCR